MDPLRNLRDRIIAEPNDVGLRRVYADQLTERGDPRGAFIHLQLAPRSAEVAAAEAELIEKYGTIWEHPITNARGSARFVRGFVEEWACDAPVFIARGKRAARATPLRRLVVRSPLHDRHLTQLLKVRAFRALPELELTALTHWPFMLLANGPELTRLNRLVLKGNPRGPSHTLRGMLRQPAFSHLRELVLDLPLSPDDGAAVGEVLPSLELLGVRHYLPLAVPAKLRVLHVISLASDEPRLAKLLEWSPLLSELSLSLPAPGALADDVIDALPARLERLSLANVQLDDDAVKTLCELPVLRDLALDGCRTSRSSREALRARFQ